MPQFVSPDPQAQVRSTTLLELKNFVSAPFQPLLDKILKAHGVFTESPEEWYDMQLGLDISQEIQENVGPHTMFSIGKKAGELRQFPSTITSLEAALESINEAYQNSHRGENIGYYEVLSVDMKEHVIEFKAHTPYPDEFDRGLLTSIARKFKPNGSMNIGVKRKEGAPSRMEDDEYTVFLISWELY